MKPVCFLGGMAAIIIVVSACAPAAKTRTAETASFDIVLEGGLVWKGWGSHPTIADIGIRGDRIEAVGDLSGFKADRRIPVDGLAVVPGFVDIHSHAVRGSRESSGLFKHPDAENYIPQGVTTVGLRQAAEQLGVHYMTAYRYVGLGQLPAEKVGGQWQIQLDDLRQLSDGPAPREPMSLETAAKELRAALVSGDEVAA